MASGPEKASVSKVTGSNRARGPISSLWIASNYRQGDWRPNIFKVRCVRIGGLCEALGRDDVHGGWTAILPSYQVSSAETESNGRFSMRVVPLLSAFVAGGPQPTKPNRYHQWSTEYY